MTERFIMHIYEVKEVMTKNDMKEVVRYLIEEDIAL